MTRTDANVTSAKNVSSGFLNELLPNLERFPNDGMQVLKCMDLLLNPKHIKNVAAQDIPVFGPKWTRQAESSTSASTTG